MKYSVAGVIPARFNSYRFPGKLLALLQGKAVLQHTYEKAAACNALDLLYVATDDERIYDLIKSLGGKPIMTSPEAPTGTDRVLEAMQKNPFLQKAEIIVNIQGDHPFISPQTISAIVQKLKDDPTAQIATAATPILDRETAELPQVVKCVFDHHGNALYFSRSLIPYSRKETTYYHHLGVYAYRRDFLLKLHQLPPSILEEVENLEQLRFLANGYKIKVAVVEDTAQGVDTPEDLLACEELLCR